MQQMIERPPRQQKDPELLRPSLTDFVAQRIGVKRRGQASIMLLVLASIASYTVLTGATPSSVRAAVMASAVVAAQLAGRPNDRLTALATAVVLVLTCRPLRRGSWLL